MSPLTDCLIESPHWFLKERRQPWAEGQHTNAFDVMLLLYRLSKHSWNPLVSEAAQNAESSCQFPEKRVNFPSSECRSSSCQVMMPAKVFSGRGSPLFMYLLRPVSFSSLRLYLDLTAFWMQYPGSRHGDTSMLQHKQTKQSESQKAQIGTVLDLVSTVLICWNYFLLIYGVFWLGFEQQKRF